MATPPATVQTEVASPVTPLVISTSDPFVVLSQAVKDGSSLLATPSSNPSSAMHGPDVDLSFEGFKDILEDSDDEPVLKKKISESDDEESVPLEAEFMGMCLSPFLHFCFCQVHSSLFFLSSLPYMSVLVFLLYCNLPLFVCLFSCFAETFEGPGVIVDIGMPSAVAPTTPISAIPTVLVFVVPSIPVSTVPSVPISTVPIAPILTGPSEFLISSLISFL